MPGVEGRRVLLTGGNRGIGMAAAKLFRERGANVCIVARTEATLASSGFAFVAADLSTRDGCSAAIKGAIDQLGGPIDILVCNHGIGSAHEKALHLTDIDDWKTSMDTNVIGPFYLTREVMPSMVEKRYGRIVYTRESYKSIRGEDHRGRRRSRMFFGIYRPIPCQLHLCDGQRLSHRRRLESNPKMRALIDSNPDVWRHELHL